MHTVTEITVALSFQKASSFSNSHRNYKAGQQAFHVGIQHRNYKAIALHQEPISNTNYTCRVNIYTTSRNISILQVGNNMPTLVTMTPLEYFRILTLKQDRLNEAERDWMEKASHSMMHVGNEMNYCMSSNPRDETHAKTVSIDLGAAGYFDAHTERRDVSVKAPATRQTSCAPSTYAGVAERILQLKAFKEKHGHVRVTTKHDKSLAAFCANMRSARRGTGTGKFVTEDRIKALDELGFDWDKHKSFEERLEELKAFKDKYGHVRVTMRHDKSLAPFCAHMRSNRRGIGTKMTITEDRIKALDELGFVWGEKHKSFDERVEELKVFKELHGHVRVTVKQDKKLAAFCANIRSARRNPEAGMTITDERIKALDDIGFEWPSRKSSNGKQEPE